MSAKLVREQIYLTTDQLERGMYLIRFTRLISDKIDSLVVNLYAKIN